MSGQWPQTPAATTETQNHSGVISPALSAVLAAQQPAERSEQYQAILEGYAILAALQGQIAQIPPEVEGVSFQPVIQSATAFANEYASTLKAAAALLGGGGNGFWEALLNLLLQVIALLSFTEGLISILRLLFAKDNKSNNKHNDKNKQESDTNKYTTNNPPRPGVKYPRNMLPVGGEHPYKPKKIKGGKPDDVTPNPNGKGYIDEDGNIWEWDQSGHGGPHWDVQNPRTGEHTNVYPDGNVWQNDDNLK